ncbi:hypothetical protein [Rhodomicrobium sp. Az07]
MLFSGSDAACRRRIAHSQCWRMIIALPDLQSTNETHHG